MCSGSVFGSVDSATFSFLAEGMDPILKGAGVNYHGLPIVNVQNGGLEGLEFSDLRDSMHSFEYDGCPGLAMRVQMTAPSGEVIKGVMSVVRRVFIRGNETPFSYHFSHKLCLGERLEADLADFKTLLEGKTAFGIRKA